MRPLSTTLGLACSSLLAACGPMLPAEELSDGSTTSTTTDAVTSSESSTTAAVDETGTTTEDEPEEPAMTRRHTLLEEDPCAGVAAGDLDGDGIDDLLALPGFAGFIAPGMSPRTVHSYLGGDPLLGPLEPHCCIQFDALNEIVLADVDGDDRRDALIAVDLEHISGDVGWLYDAIELLIRDPAGGYLAQSHVVGDSGFLLPTRAAAGTWLPDATAVAIAREQELALFVSDGLTLVEPPPEAFVPLPDFVLDLSAVDLDGDGLDDVVALLDDGVVLIPNPGDGTLSAPIESMPPWQGTTLLVGELDGVPPLDLVLPDDGGLTIGLMGPGGPTWQWHELEVPNAATLADVDGDGALDLVTVTNEELVAHLGAGDGTFDAAATTLVPGAGTQIEGIVTADFDGNGTPELAVCDELGVLVVQLTP